MENYSELPVLELYNDVFFLHSFLDEYIGNGKGNDCKKTINNFLLHSPKPYKINFIKASKSALDILVVMKKIINVSCCVEMTPGSHFYPAFSNNLIFSYDLSTRNTLPDSKYTTKVYDRIYLKRTGKGYDFSADIYENTKQFASAYKTLNYYIDINVEKNINHEIDQIIENSLIKSNTSPVFFCAGHSKHLIGLTLTHKYVIITNSGNGLEHHKTRTTRNYDPETGKGGGGAVIPVTENPGFNDDPNNIDFQSHHLPAYPQCVLFFSRPCDDILKKILREFNQIKTLYHNIDINSVYAIIYKLHFFDQIQSAKYNEKFQTFMREFSEELIIKYKLINGIEITKYEPWVNVYSRPVINEYQPTTSNILSAPWIVPEYHEEAIYNIDLDYGEIMRKLSLIVTNNFHIHIFYNKTTIKLDDVGEKIISMIANYEPYCQLINTILKENNIHIDLEYVPIHILVLANISGVIEKKRIIRDTEIDTLYFSKVFHANPEVNTNDKIKKYQKYIISQISKKYISYPDNINIKNLIPDNFDSLYNEQQNAICDKLSQENDFNEFIHKIPEREYDHWISFEFTEQHIETMRNILQDLFSTPIINEIDNAVLNSKKYNLFNNINEKVGELQQEILIKTSKNGFSKFNHYSGSDNHNREILSFDLFCDILLHTSTVSNKSIIIKKNHKMFLKSYHSVIDSSFESPAKLLLTKLKNQIPELFYKVSQRKLESLYPDDFFVREQFSGSCTFNGIILALSLFGPHNVINHPNGSLVPYHKDYTTLKSELQNHQIKMIHRSLDNGYVLAEKDRLIVDALDLIYEHEKREKHEKHDKTFIDALREKLPKQTVSKIDIKFLKGIVQESEELVIIDFYSKINIVPGDDLRSVLSMLDIVDEIIANNKYIDYRFTHLVMGPVINWILDFETTALALILPDTDIVNSTMDIILNKFYALTKMEKQTYDQNKNKSRDTLGLYIASLYLVFKTLDMKHIFNSKILKENSEIYKISHDRIRLLENLYLTTIINEFAMKDLCKMIEKYQFLILLSNSESYIYNEILSLPLPNQNENNDDNENDKDDKYDELANQCSKLEEIQEIQYLKIF